MTLRARLTATFLLVVLVPLLVGGALVFGLVLPRAVGDLQGQGLRAGAASAVAAVLERCRRAEAAALAAAAARGSAEPGPSLQRALQQLVDRQLAAGARVVDAGGRLQAAAGSLPATSPPDCASGQVAATSEGPQLAATQAIASATGAAAGEAVAVLDVDAAWLRGLAVTPDDTGVVLLAGGRPVAATSAVDDALLRRATNDPGAVVSIDGRVAVTALGPRDAPFGVLLVQPSRLELQALWWLFPLGVVAAGSVAVVLASGLARATTRPLEELGSAATRVAEGDLTTTMDVRSRDEVGRLASAFNTMTVRVRDHVEALEHSGRQLRDGVARLGEALSGTHDLDRILAVVLDTAMAATAARAGAVLMRDGGTGDLRLSVGRKLSERGVPDDLRVRVGLGICGTVAASGAPLSGRSGRAEGQLVPGPGEPDGCPVVAVPLSSSSTVAGVLLLWDRVRGDDFTDDDLATLQTFTSQATVAVDNVLLHEEARRLSMSDGLTGLANFRGFSTTVGKEIERAARFDRPLALLLLDLDHFKLVNDVWGHQRGDAVLVELAARVRGQVRDVDTPARYGGEEFVVVLPETDRHGAAQAAERICAAVRRRPFGDAGDPPIEVTVSIGVAVFPEHGTSSTTLLRRADEALYAVKADGRDGWRLAVAEGDRPVPDSTAGDRRTPEADRRPS